jgi:hypothetical protein
MQRDVNMSEKPVMNKHTLQLGICDIESGKQPLLPTHFRQGTPLATMFRRRILVLLYCPVRYFG